MGTTGKSILIAFVVAGFSVAARAGDAATTAAFSRRPIATKAGDKVRIEFAVDRETDVTVTVEDANGRVVRHLAAGRLGKNAPAPLKPNTLEQSLEWDGKADYGRAAGAGPFTVRVGLGLQPVMKELIGQDPADLGVVRSLAVGPNGDLYVFHLYGQIHPDDHNAAIAVFSRAGRYVRTIMPYPSTLPDERLKGLKRIQLADGSRVPFIYQIETRSYLPGLGNLPKERAVVTRDGRLAFVGILEGPRPFANPGEARLLVLNTDGSVRQGQCLRDRLWQRPGLRLRARCQAARPDQGPAAAARRGPPTDRRGLCPGRQGRRLAGVGQVRRLPVRQGSLPCHA